MDELAKILIVEDDVTIRTLIGMALMGAGFKEVRSEARGDDGLAEARRWKPDLVLLDLMLPGLDGFTVRRGLPITEGVEFDGLRLDEANVVATLRGRPLDLTGGEFKLLVRRVAHRGRVFSRPPDERTIDVQVANLRRKLGAWGRHIETIRGVGYRISV